MLKQREELFKNIFGIIDVLFTLFAFLLAYYFRDLQLDTNISKEYLMLAILVVPIWFFLLRLSNLTMFHRTKSYAAIFIEYLLVVSAGLAFLFLFIFLLKLTSISRVFMAIFGILDFLLLYTVKIISYSIFKYFRSKGFNTRNVLIMADSSSAAFIQRLLNNKQWGYNVHSIISDSKSIKQQFGNICTVLPNNCNLDYFLESNPIDEVIYSQTSFNQKYIKDLIYSCQEIGVIFRLHSELFSMVVNRGHLSNFGEFTLLTFDNTPADKLGLYFKKVIDYLLAILILVVFSPFMLIISLIIKLTSDGPVIFKQKRVGLRGREFYVYKFRTMVQDAEVKKETLMAMNEMDGPVFKIKNDPRVTPFGRFLRKSSLDEFPQFLNVLKGDMSIVGPRPPVPKEVKEYERWQLRRLSMKPGITCIWQVSGRNAISFEKWMRLDLQYIDTWSLKLDFVILLKTIRTVLKANGH